MKLFWLVWLDDMAWEESCRCKKTIRPLECNKILICKNKTLGYQSADWEPKQECDADAGHKLRKIFAGKKQKNK